MSSRPARLPQVRKSAESSSLSNSTFSHQVGSGFVSTASNLGKNSNLHMNTVSNAGSKANGSRKSTPIYAVDDGPNTSSLSQSLPPKFNSTLITAPPTYSTQYPSTIGPTIACSNCGKVQRIDQSKLITHPSTKDRYFACSELCYRDILTTLNLTDQGDASLPPKHGTYGKLSAAQKPQAPTIRQQAFTPTTQTPVSQLPYHHFQKQNPYLNFPTVSTSVVQPVVSSQPSASPYIASFNTYPPVHHTRMSSSSSSPLSVNSSIYSAPQSLAWTPSPQMSVAPSIPSPQLPSTSYKFSAPKSHSSTQHTSITHHNTPTLLNKKSTKYEKSEKTKKQKEHSHQQQQPHGNLSRRKIREATKLNIQQDKAMENTDGIAVNLQSWKKQRNSAPRFWKVKHVVVDTNILLDEQHPDVMFELHRLVPSIHFIIPYMLLKELDSLKTSKGKSHAARSAIGRLYDQIVTGKEDWIKPQKTEQREPLEGVTNSGKGKSSGDDLILECVNYFHKYSPTTSKVLLLTHDKNLRLRAISAGFLTGTVDELKTFAETLRFLQQDRSVIRAMLSAETSVGKKRDPVDLDLSDFEGDREEVEEDEFAKRKREIAQQEQELAKVAGATSKQLKELENERSQQKAVADALPPGTKTDLYEDSSDSESQTMSSDASPSISKDGSKRTQSISIQSSPSGSDSSDTDTKKSKKRKIPDVISIDSSDEDIPVPASKKHKSS